MKGLALICAVFLCFEGEAQVRKICSLEQVPEVSGSVWVNEAFWVLGDGGNPAKLFKIDTSSGSIQDSTSFENAENIDWEELAYNGTEIFIGDFGNNNGTRKDLKIYRFPSNQLGKSNVHCDTLSFDYPSQKEFNSNPFTLCDCEAMLAFKDSILLFSKSYADAQCRIYSIPNKPGNVSCTLLDSIQLDFLVTGASMNGNDLWLVGYGYNGKLVPKLLNTTFANGKVGQVLSVKNLTITGPLQVESCIRTQDHVYFTAESSNGYPAGLFENHSQLLSAMPLSNHNIEIYPNPTQDCIIVQNPENLELEITVDDSHGKQIMEISTKERTSKHSATALPSGVYFIEVKQRNKTQGEQIILRLQFIKE